MHELVGDALVRYWYHSLQKNHGFVINRKQEWIVINVFLKMMMILDVCVHH